MTNKMADKKRTASQNRMAASATPVRSSDKQKEQQSGKAKVATREQVNKSGRRESRQTSETRTRFRNNRIVRFIRDAYYELRYKVTWPTFIEARNMTFVVIGLSAAVGIILGLVDGGLTQLFLIITGK